MAGAGQAGVHGPVADEQHGVGVGVLGVAVDGQRQHLGADAVAAAQEHLRQGGAGARALVQGDALDVGPRHAAEQRHAQHGAARGDADVRHDGVGAGAEVFDDRDEGDVEFGGGESVGESAGQVEDEFGLRGQFLQVADERLGVEVVDRADADDVAHVAAPSLSIRAL